MSDVFSLFTGTIKFFRPREQYGFIFVDVEHQDEIGEREIFYHFSNGCLVLTGRSEPILVPSSHPSYFSSVWLKDPYKGDRVVFHLGERDTGELFASHWAYREQYDFAREILRGENPLPAELAITTSHFEANGRVLEHV